MNWRTVLTAIVKDEADYIVDWLCYHISLGVEHFFIYDNGSSDNTRELLTKFVNGGVVTLVSWPMRGGQIDAYSHAIKFLSGNAEWVGFLDIDEFLVMHEHENVYEFLSSLNADQVLLPWRNFPYSGHQDPPVSVKGVAARIS
jgi:glycosyltransferase involved in cell wall biosynthesis